MWCSVALVGVRSKVGRLCSKYSEMQISGPRHHFDNDPSLNLKNLYSIRAVPAARAINNILTMHVCFGIIIFLQRLNLESINGARGSLLVCSWGIIGTGPFAVRLSLQHCQMCFGWGAVKRSTGTYLLGCKMIFCLFKRCQKCMRKCVCVGGGYQRSERN